MKAFTIEWYSARSPTRLGLDRPYVTRTITLMPCTDSSAIRNESIETDTVVDAGYFMDGWNIIPGDMIQLQGDEEDETRIQITAIDYENNIITIESNITWTQNQGISLAYEGNAPDQGAHEYGLNIYNPGTTNNGSSPEEYDEDPVPGPRGEGGGCFITQIFPVWKRR